MTAGIQPTLASVNNQAGNLVISLRDILQSITEFQGWLSAVGSAGLEALGLGTTDTATMISAFNDLADLAKIYDGTTSTHLTGTYAYQTFANQLTGFN